MAVLAIDQCHGFKPFSRPPRCKLQSFTQLDYKMLNFNESELKQSLPHASPFTNSNIHKSFSTPCLSLSFKHEETLGKTSRIEILVGHAKPRVRALVVEVAIAMASGLKPEPTSSGLGGAYILRSRSGDKLAVAKPIDEEPLAFNNPKGLAGRLLGQPGMKSSIRIGETGLRESAAYLLDHDGFSGVPPTALVKFSHVKFNLTSDMNPPYKIASLQRFVDHDSDSGDLGSSSFSVSSVHRIGILDVRLMNLDRHAGNILVRQRQDSYAGGKAELVPIDHGFCLPESLDDPYFEWLHWPQASIPFSEYETNYISNIDPYKDAELLRTELPSLRESSVRVLVLCTIFLKKATMYGLCLADIGEMMTREFIAGEEKWSCLERLCINAKSKVKSEASDDSVESDQDEEVDETFQYDDESNSHVEGKLSKYPRFSSLTTTFPLINQKYEVDDYDLDTILNNVANEDGDRDDNLKTSSIMMRSLSFPVPSYNCDQGISFGEMDNEEWRLFLENFEELLPQAFEERSSIGLGKQRLGSSCDF